MSLAFSLIFNLDLYIDSPADVAATVLMFKCPQVLVGRAIDGALSVCT